MALGVEPGACDGSCLEGTGTKAYVVIVREEAP